MAPFRWVEQIESELEAGAWKVIAEARESGSVGIFRHDGEVRMGLIDEIVHAIAPERILFEAPRKDQQVWFVRRLGPGRQPRQHHARRTCSRWRRSASVCAPTPPSPISMTDGAAGPVAA